MGPQLTAEAPVITPTVIADNVKRAWERFVLRDQRKNTPRGHVWASSWRPCERRMVYDMAYADQQPPFPADVQAKFRRGSDRERDLLADLGRIGRDATPAFEVVGQQEYFTVRDRKGRVAITGKVDARLAVHGLRAPIEVKGWSPQIVDRIDSFDDVFNSPWTRSGGYQLLTYLYASNEPFGFMVLDRSGLPEILPVELYNHLDRVEDFLQKAERAIDHVEAKTLPDFYTEDPAECKRCQWYGHTCNPPLAADGMQIVIDPDLEARLARRAELEEAADEYDRLDKDVKKQLRGIEHAVVGAFVVNGKWQKNTKYEIPEDLKAKYAKTDPKGRFILEIVKV